MLRSKGVTKVGRNRLKMVCQVVLGGLKTGQSVLAAAECLADEGLMLYLAPLGLTVSTYEDFRGAKLPVLGALDTSASRKS